MSKHVYVLGSNSFSGSHFVRQALEAGYRVTGISRSQEAEPVFLAYMFGRTSHPARYTFLKADLNHDLDPILSRMEADKPEYIVNFAAQGMVAESWLNPEHWLRTNTLSPLLLHDRLRKHLWLKKFVQISTPEVYGATQGSIKEDSPYNPSTPYAVSKAATDMSLRCFFNAYNFPVVFTRAANVYGPGQQLYRIIPRAVICFLTGQRLTLHGGGRSMRAFVHISDVCTATMKIMTSARPGEIFHVASQDYLSIRDLVLRIAEIMNIRPEEHIVSGEERLGKDASYMLDDAKLRKTLGWENKYSLDDGIGEVCAWVEDNLSVLQNCPQQYQHKP